MSDHKKLMLIEGVLDDMDISDGLKLDVIQALIDGDMETYEELYC